MEKTTEEVSNHDIGPGSGGISASADPINEGISTDTDEKNIIKPGETGPGYEPIGRIVKPTDPGPGGIEPGLPGNHEPEPTVPGPGI